MGFWSDKQIELTEGGMDLWRAAERFVCAECFDDPALKAVVRAAAQAGSCDFCGDEARVAGLDHVVRHMAAALSREWSSADGELPMDDETGEYMLEDTYNTDELLYMIDLELPRDPDDTLRSEIAGALPDLVWCRDRPLIPQPHEAIANSWRSFCHVIKHERRFYFLHHQTPELETDFEQEVSAYTIPELLDAVAAYAARADLFVTVPTGTRYIRAQERDDPNAAPFGPRRMGPPPIEKATRANRMSPAGVPMFYGAEDSETSLREITRTAGEFALGTFETLRPLQLLDLRLAPPVPSLFDVARAEDRPFARFMREFIADFQKPVTEGAEVEYVPTQVVTEYIRSIVRHQDQPIDGILYASTRRVDGTAVVLFADTEAVEDAAAAERYGAPEPWLRMIGYEQQYFDPEVEPPALEAS